MFSPVSYRSPSLGLTNVNQNYCDEHSRQMFYCKEPIVWIFHDSAHSTLHCFITQAAHKIQVNANQQHQVCKNGKEQAKPVIGFNIRPVACQQTINDGK